MITTQINGRTFVIDGKGEFSPAEEQTLEEYLHGMNAQDAARKRHRSPETIKTQRKSIREKTCSHNVGGVLVYCFSKDYIRTLMLALSISGAGELLRSRPASFSPSRPVAARQQLGRKEISGVYC